MVKCIVPQLASSLPHTSLQSATSPPKHAYNIILMYLSVTCSFTISLTPSLPLLSLPPPSLPPSLSPSLCPPLHSLSLLGELSLPVFLALNLHQFLVQSLQTILAAVQVSECCSRALLYLSRQLYQYITAQLCTDTPCLQCKKELCQ